MNRARGNSMNNMGGMTNNGMTPDVMERNLNGNQLNNGGSTYGLNPNGGRLSGSLAEQIRALGFVKTELELYLDTHPMCQTALDYYYQTIKELNRLTEMYQNTTGPLTAAGNMSTDRWQWVDGPWPWQQAGDFAREEDKR